MYVTKGRLRSQQQVSFSSPFPFFLLFIVTLQILIIKEKNQKKSFSCFPTAIFCQENPLISCKWKYDDKKITENKGIREWFATFYFIQALIRKENKPYLDQR